MGSHVDLNGLLQTDRGTISRDVFVNRDLYQEELEKLFSRAWLLVGHESLIPNPGDFYLSRMGEESVVLCRDGKGKVHVFLNSCRHRGMKVCRYEHGNTNQFVCPYHSWSYNTDGKLNGVPHYRTLYEGVVDKDEWSLIEVPRLGLYKGTVWASWDANAPELLDYFGGMREHLDQALDARDGREGGSEVIGVQKWIIPTNWKIAAAEFLGDTYHNPSHRSVDMIGIGPSAAAGKKGRRDDESAKAQHIWVSFPQGHGTHSTVQPEDNEYVEAFLDNPTVEAYFRECHEERKRRLGDKARLISLVGTIFPNMSYLGRQPRGMSIWHPHGPTSTEAWRFFLVDKDAPAEVKDLLRRYYMRYSGPAGMTEQDDMENWLYATEASSGTIARRYPLNYQQSLNTKPTVGPDRSQTSLQMSEHSARRFFSRWQDYLQGASWDQLVGNNDKAASELVAAK